jgi:ribonuclease D
MIWIDSQAAFDELMARLETLPVIAVDTEADSLHSYFDKVCLIQISSADEDYVIDPLQKIDLARFGRILGNPQITKVLHGSDYDLRILNRDFGFTIENLVDTMICAQMLGYESIGLAALLERHFGLNVDKKHQRADWSMRPLTPDMLAYAALDTHHLTRLSEELRAALVGMGRWEWAAEEFNRLEAIRFRDATEESEPFRKLKGITGLDRRSLGVVAALHAWRDGLAQKADRPPFKIIGNDAIIDIARVFPRSQPDLARIKSVAAYHRGRYGKTIVDLVDGVMALPEESLPEKTEPKSWLRDKMLERRVDQLKKVRDRYASSLRIDPAVVAPRHVLTAIATMRPQTVEELDAIPAMRKWQKELMGRDLIGALANPQMELA